MRIGRGDDLRAWRFVVELDALDFLAARQNLVRRGDDLFDVLVDGAEVPIEILDAILEAHDVFDQQSDFRQNLVGRLAHAGIFLNLLDHLNCQHQQRRRNDDNAGAISLLQDIIEAVVQLGEHRFGRDEHESDVLGLALDQIFPGNVVDVLAEILTQLTHGLKPFFVGFGVFERGGGFQREFGIDNQMPLVRHVDAAVWPGIVGQRELELISALWQPVGDDRLHAALAEGAAALLVVENFLQRRHRRGQIGDVLLRRVDHR